MENNINSLHIEFYGLPGSGKSTISHELSLYLRKKGYKVEEPSYTIDNKDKKVMRYLKKMFYAVLLMIVDYRQYRFLKRLLKENSYKGIKNTKQLFNIAYKEYIYLHPKAQTIYVWDQGMLQSSISLSTYSDVSVIDNCKFLIQNYTIKPIYIKTSKEEIYRRLKTREKHGSRLEKTIGVEQDELFQTIDSCCEKIKLKDTIIISNSDINTGVETIIEKLNI